MNMNYYFDINHNLNEFYILATFDNLKHFDNQIIYQYHLRQYFIS